MSWSGTITVEIIVLADITARGVGTKAGVGTVATAVVVAVETVATVMVADVMATEGAKATRQEAPLGSSCSREVSCGRVSR